MSLFRPSEPSFLFLYLDNEQPVEERKKPILVEWRKKRIQCLRQSNEGGARLPYRKWQNTIDSDYRRATSINEETFHVYGWKTMLLIPLILNMSSSVVWEIQCILCENASGFCVQNGKQILKFTWNRKGHQIAKRVWTKQLWRIPTSRFQNLIQSFATSSKEESTAYRSRWIIEAEWWKF